MGTKAYAERQSGNVPLTIEETKLRTNAPNPFHKSTTISYQLASEQDVTVDVYDVLGRKVATLVDRHEASGVHQVTWRVADGQSISSGLCFVRMEAVSYTGTRKVTVVR